MPELAINVWNAHVTASKLWGNPYAKPLSDLRKVLRGDQVPAEMADAFDVLSERWRKDFSLDPRLVGAWSFEAKDGHQHQLICEMRLPDGVHALVPPPTEKRIAIGGQFLDEVRTRLEGASYLSFPVENHRAMIGSDGFVTIHSKMPTALQLFAEGRLSRIGGAPVEVMVDGRKLRTMVLSEIRCITNHGHYDVVELVFRPAIPGAIDA
jgi:hypothetical protein